VLSGWGTMTPAGDAPATTASSVEKVILPAIQSFCARNPDRKAISLIGDILDKADKLKGKWTKGTVKWAAERAS
jgi:hypothetical protein